MNEKETSSMLLEHIIDIKSSIGGIEEHLKNLNSKVATHEKRFGIDCPLKHKELEEKINKRREDINNRLDNLEKGHAEIKTASKVTVRIMSAVFALAQVLITWFIMK